MIRPATVFAVCFSLLPFTSQAEDNDDIIAGGRLYDIWWVDTNLQRPQNEHPAYPEKGRKKSATTWRCKECHGWDYLGKNGAYKKGSHFTGIKGIRDKSGANVDDLVSLLKDKNHQFGKIIATSELKSLALFISKGQVDMDKHIDRGTKKAKGDAINGKSAFEKQCQRCHGKKGTKLNLGINTGRKAYMGDLSNENPWETLHKIRFGQPGSTMGMDQMHSGGHLMHEHHQNEYTMNEAMPPMYNTLTLDEQINLLTYLQTLTTADSLRVF